MSAIRFDSLRTLAFGSIGANYTAIQTPISHAWRAFKATNTTDALLFISFDGTTDNLIVPADGFVLYDIGANADQGASTGLTLDIGTQFLGKYGSVPSRGGIYIEGYYQRGQ